MDSENISAFMVHHVLSKKNKKNKKKRLRKPRKGLLQQRNHTASRNAAPEVKNDSNSFNHSIETTENPVNSTVQSRESLMNCKTGNEVMLNGSIPKLNTFEKSFAEKRLFEWLINPISLETFHTFYWEKLPLHVSKRQPEFSSLLSTPIIDNLLRYSNIIYTKNIDITFYSNGVKELHNQEGVARPHVVWDFYCNKCSIRLLNPQTFVPNIHKLNSELQEYFGCFVGCNAYLTPPHSQGFAPHYDDIEAFILQVEGKKLWKVYEPRSENDVLPRYSSCDFNADEIGSPVMEVLLEEGDLLYLPRGYIHQACTQDSNHSLHITISVYQCNAWIDLLEKVIPKALENAWKNDVDFRKGLPLDYLKSSGLARNTNYKDTRSYLKNNVKRLIQKLTDHINIDTAVDQLGLKLMNDALPPVLTEEEKKCSVFEGGLSMKKKGKLGGNDLPITENDEIVLLRQYVARFVKEFEKSKKGKDKAIYKLYYTTDNSLEYHGEPTSFFIIPKQLVKAVQTLFQRYPDYTTFADLPVESFEEKVNLVADLWERGVVRTRRANSSGVK